MAAPDPNRVKLVVVAVDVVALAAPGTAWNGGSLGMSPSAPHVSKTIREPGTLVVPLAVASILKSKVTS
jgi:hypothetical protein